MSFKDVAQLVAVLLYGLAWYVKKAFGWDVQPSVLVGVGGLLATFIMHAPAMTGKWAPIFTKALGVAFTAVAIAFTVAPVETAGALKLSTQIEATELTTVPTQSVPSAEHTVVEPAGSNVPAPPVAPDVVGGTTEALAPAGTLPVAPDASPATTTKANDVTKANDTNEPHDAGKTPDAAGQ